MPEEFKTQIFKTTSQWESGLLYRLEGLKDRGITVCSVPTFVEWIQGMDGIGNPGGIAIDECGQIYFIDRDSGKLYLFDPITKRLERITVITDSCDKTVEIKEGTKIIIDSLTLWVLDPGNHRLLGFSRENFQVKYVINLEAPVDIGVDERGHTYVLDKKSGQIIEYDNCGRFIKSFGQSYLKEPVGMALGKENNLYVIDKGYNGFLRFTRDGEYLGIVGDFKNISDDFMPSVVTTDKEGNIFVVDGKTGIIHQFDPDGSHVAKIQIPGFTGTIHGLAADSKGNLYASTNQGIALLKTQDVFTKEPGVYYSKTLDSGIQYCQWNRLELKVDLPPKTLLEVYYYSSDDQNLRDKIDQILSDPAKSTEEKADSIDNQIVTWVGPEKNPKDMLFRKKTGRFLWLKLALSTFDEKVRPAVTEMRVYYPRISYLRYLPAVYQEDPISSEFLERFLSLFETVFYGLETEISAVFKYFDPDTTPENFLTWLASWLNFGLEEAWPEGKKREFIRRASELYKLKGTALGIQRLIEIYTGKTPLIIEYSRIGKPVVLGGNFKLGVDSLIIQTPIRGFRLGDDSILGRVALRDTVQMPEDPFLQIAHRFTIILDLTPEEFAFYEKGLVRILNEEKPAHTIYNLRVIREAMVGIGTYVGISTKVADYEPLRLGINAGIGSNIVVMGGEKAGRVEQHSMLEKDTELI
ncbi:MAG TPA: phage tail protein I [Thermodesulfobacteriota bacterium]|nr:phage tail protein I [Thermodesulfobacteriota bacterium]